MDRASAGKSELLCRGEGSLNTSQRRGGSSIIMMYHASDRQEFCCHPRTRITRARQWTTTRLKLRATVPRVPTSSTSMILQHANLDAMYKSNERREQKKQRLQSVIFTPCVNEKKRSVPLLCYCKEYSNQSTFLAGVESSTTIGHVEIKLQN